MTPDIYITKYPEIFRIDVHIADSNGPFGNRGNWCADPVEYWREIMGLERVLHRNPNLVQSGFFRSKPTKG